MAIVQRALRTQPNTRQLSNRVPDFEKLCMVLDEYEIQSVAKAAHVAPATLYFWLDGTTQNPRIDTLTRVAEALGFSFRLVRNT